MKSKDIMQFSPIKKENLNSEQYTFSLITETYHEGLIEDKEMTKFQYELMEIVSKLIRKFTSGESSSIPEETAQKIFLSVSYCIDAYSMSFIEPIDCFKLLQSKGMRSFYEESMQFINSYIDEAKLLYKRVLENKLNIPLEAYNATIDEGLKAFFINYGEVYEAQNTIITLDYPLFADNIKLQGIIRIKQYLEHLNLENIFCQLFNIEDIKSILSDYGNTYNTDYKDLLINVFEILINNCIFSSMLGMDSFNLLISESQCDFLYENLKSKKQEEISEMVSTAIENVVVNLKLKFEMHTDLGLESKTLDDAYNNKIESLIENLKTYIQNTKTSFLSKFTSSLKSNSLNKLLIVHNSFEPQSEQNFNEGSFMTDENFRNVIKKLSQCSSTQEKIKIINSCVESLRDFIDILNSDCLFDDEFSSVFATLGDFELSLLTKTVFDDQLKYGNLNLSPKTLDSKHTDFEWQTHFVKYLNSINPNKLKIIENLLKL